MYALNTNKGTTIRHPDIGMLEAGTAVLISDDLVPIAKHLKGVVVFETIAGIDESKVSKGLYGKDIASLKKQMESIEIIPEITYHDFVKKYRDVKIASAKWEEYKQSKENKE